MKSIKKKNYLIYLFLLGLSLSIMGMTASVVAGEWSPIAAGLLMAGLVTIGFWLIAVINSSPGFWKRRSTQSGTNAIIATLAMLAILGLVNFLGVRYAQRFDLTENQLFTLSPQSQTVVKKLQQPVKVWLFTPNPNPTDVELLRNYRRYGSNLEYEFVDPQRKPGLAQRFSIQEPGQVFLEYGTERRFVQMVSDAERLSEVRLTNSIEQVMSDRTDTVYFLQGHGEHPLEEVEGGLSQAVSVLKDKNFTVVPLNLADRSEVPKDASLVVIAGPKRALFEGEVQALQNYLSSGGSLLLMLDPETNAGLDNLLANWGIKLPPQIVIDASGQERVVNLGPATSLVTTYGNHPITKDFGNGFSFYPLARPVETTPVKGVETTPLLLTDEKSWGESTPNNEPLQFEPQNGDRPGPVTIGVALSRQSQPSSVSPTPTPQPTASPQTSASPSPSPTGQAKPSPSPAAQATASPQASASPSPSSTGQAKPSPSPAAQVTKSPQASASPSPAAKAQVKPSPLPTAQATTSPQASASSSPAAKAQAKPSPSPAAQATATPQASLSPSPSPTGQGKPSPSPAVQATATPQASLSPSPSPTGQGKPSPSPAAQATVTPQASLSPSPSPTAQATISPQVSPSPNGQPLPPLTNEAKTDQKISEERLVVIGNSRFITNGAFDQPVLNSDVLLNSISWLSKRDEQALSIRPREQKSRRINLTQLQAGILGWTALVIMPVLGLTTAGVIWWRRR